MRRVTGVGGIFLKAKDPVALRDWYQRHLGIDVQAWGGAAFRWEDGSGQPYRGTTVWSIMPDTTPYFDPSRAPFMVNYRVEDLHALLAALRAEGCAVEDKVDESEFG
ncbi:MAG TPA: hypothetical protein VFV33_07050, partial [Gemmatimonadaceae bacterium]|nr:hypothetical protein [Gemmatimonadaceae bacterium]